MCISFLRDSLKSIQWLVSYFANRGLHNVCLLIKTSKLLMTSRVTFVLWYEKTKRRWPFWERPAQITRRLMIPPHVGSWRTTSTYLAVSCSRVDTVTCRQPWCFCRRSAVVLAAFLQQLKQDARRRSGGNTITFSELSPSPTARHRAWWKQKEQQILVSGHEGSHDALEELQPVEANASSVVWSPAPERSPLVSFFVFVAPCRLALWCRLNWGPSELQEL